MLSKIKNSKLAKYITVACITAMIACLGCISVFAESSQPDFSTTLSSSFTTLQGDIFTYIGVVLPIALGVVAAFFGIKAAIRFFKSTAK